jgi:hypothetical protein
VAYLILLLLLGAGGITRLMLAQRRRQSELQTVEGFRTSLEAISGPATMEASPTVNRFDQRRARATGERPSSALDPERRAAAKARIEERRAARRNSLG